MFCVLLLLYFSILTTDVNHSNHRDSEEKKIQKYNNNRKVKYNF